jgi:hypothetical protein
MKLGWYGEDQLEQGASFETSERPRGHMTVSLIDNVDMHLLPRKLVYEMTHSKQGNGTYIHFQA